MVKKIIRRVQILKKRRDRQRQRSIKFLIGWKEWCSLPTLDIPAIKAKIDTGAKTSALHAYRIEPFSHNHQPWVRFYLHPIQRNSKISLTCMAPIVDQRFVSSSTGHRELRYVVESKIKIGRKIWTIELTLTNRDKMRFRMLLGRDALKGNAIIDPLTNHKTGRMTSRQAIKQFYNKVSNS